MTPSQTKMETQKQTTCAHFTPAPPADVMFCGTKELRIGAGSPLCISPREATMILQPCIVSEDAGAVAAQIPSTMELTLEWTLAMGSRPGSALGKQERYPRPPLRPLVLHKRSRQTMEHKVSWVHLLVTLRTHHIDCGCAGTKSV